MNERYFTAAFVNQKALCQDRDRTTLREDGSTLSVIKHRMCSVYTQHPCLHTIVSNTNSVGGNRGESGRGQDDVRADTWSLSRW